MAGTITAIGRRGRGFAPCHRCGHIVDHAEAVEVTRPPAKRGVWVCAPCADQMTGRNRDG